MADEGGAETALGGGEKPAEQPSGWTEGWEPADAGIVEKKGWQSPKELFKSYRELEKTLGSDKIVLPKDSEDAEAWNGVFNRLGRPESPEKYVMPKGADEATFKEAAQELYKAGFTQKQIEAAAAFDISRQAKAVEAMGEAAKADSDKAMQTLESEWGTKTPEQIEHNRRAMRAFGISVDQATKYMASGGAEPFMRLLNAAGKSMREDSVANLQDETSLGFGLTKNRAAAELAEKKSDKVFMDRWMKGDKAADAIMDRLQKAAT